MNRDWPPVLLNFLLLSLASISAILLIRGLIVAIRSKSLKPLKWGVLLVIITILLFFGVVIAGQIFSVGAPDIRRIPTLE